MKLCLVCHFQFSDEQQVCPKDNAQLVPLSDDPLIGSVVQDRYKIESVIGKGSMGSVYKATQELIGREVAVKVLHPQLVSDTESLKRFHQQARAASRLNHPHIITLYDYGVVAGGQPYIVMDLLYGTTLANLLLEREYLSVDETLVIFKQICDALGDAHKHGVIHRDVKPENIVLEDNNTQKFWVKVVDFGIAKLIQGSDETVQRITKTGTVCGSPAYMSPEQFQGLDVDQRSDIYSLGAVLFEVLTGRLPFTAANLVTLMSQHVGVPAPRLGEVKPDLDFRPELEKVVARALAKDPNARQRSMEDLWDELQTAYRDRMSVVKGAQSIEEIPSLAAQADSVNEEAIQKVVSSALSVKSQKMEQVESAQQRSTLPREQVVSVQTPPSQKAPSQRLPKSRSGVSAGAQLVGFVQRLLPYALTVGLIGGLLLVLKNDTSISTIVEKQLKPLIVAVSGQSAARVDVQELFEAGKFGAVRSILEERQKNQSLSKSDFEVLNRTYVRMAELEAKAKHYKNAVFLLEQVSGKSKEGGKARSLLRRYKRLSWKHAAPGSARAS